MKEEKFAFSTMLHCACFQNFSLMQIQGKVINLFLTIHVPKHWLFIRSEFDLIEGKLDLDHAFDFCITISLNISYTTTFIQ